ncbi:MAG: hypothetical protein F6K47_15745 [Symploca sp. SIO2E6]|nr:hypothetical protein [Symploca sp. SIO2E6]
MKKLVILVLATMILCVGMRVSVEAATVRAKNFEDIQQISQLGKGSRVEELMESRGLEVYLSGSSWIMKGSRASIQEFEELCYEERGEVWVNKNIGYRVVCQVRD